MICLAIIAISLASISFQLPDLIESIFGIAESLNVINDNLSH